MPVNSQRPAQPSGSEASVNILSPSSIKHRGTKSKIEYKRGQKRRFGAAGIINVLLTNLVLQFLLASNTTTVTAATLISQVINTCLGYAIYGKMVFRARGLRNHQPLLRYLVLMTAMWLLNTMGIEAGKAISINQNIAAAALIPCLAVVSFLGQKYWVFKI